MSVVLRLGMMIRLMTEMVLMVVTALTKLFSYLTNLMIASDRKFV